MKRDEAKRLVEQTFQNPFSKDNFDSFIRNLLHGIEPPSTSVVAGAQLPKGFEDHIVSITRLGKYEDPAGDVLDALAVKLKNPASLDRARTRQRNLMAHYLATRTKDAALVAFYSDDSPDWRFSFVRLAYETETTESGRVRPKREFTPARRFSFLVGETEPSHTAQQQLAPLLEKSERLAITDIEAAFNIETVTNEFFERYKELFLKIKDELDGQVKRDRNIEQEFERCNIDTVSFAKKLLGQIVFLYFIQKKGWLGVNEGAKWGEGDKDFLFRLYQNRGGRNYFKDILEPFFYEALALERAGDIYKELDCKVPFLNGGLFEPLNGYQWKTTPLNLDNELFAEIFSVCNLYNFTVREDEPLEKEVAVDPEMLGKVFENLLEVKDRRSKGAYYTPREIVHYMCQESLINYLDVTVNGKKEIVSKGDLETLVRRGDVFLENDLAKDAGRKSGEYGLPESVRSSAQNLDRALAAVKICDPAIGSGAFPVGMMTEIVKVRTVLSHTPALEGKPFRTAYDFKWHCIENNLYGVDIEPSAIEIAKLRLWLSLVVDEENYDHIRPLPNLDYRIVCGNSLLSVEKNLFNFALYSELEVKKNQYFGSTSQKNKDILRREIDLIIEQLTDGNRTFDFEVYFSEVFTANSGFDVIIANPPYIKEYVDRSAFDGLRSSPYYQGKMDIWYFFACKGIDLARPNTGIVTFIAQNNWVTSHGASRMRTKILDDAKIVVLIDFGSYMVFQAGIQTMIMIFQRNKNDRHFEFDYRHLSSRRIAADDLVMFMTGEKEDAGKFLQPKIDRDKLRNNTFTFSSPDLELILDKINNHANFRLDGSTEIAQGIVPNPDSVGNSNIKKISPKTVKQFGIKVGDGVFVTPVNYFSKLNEYEKSLLKPMYEPTDLERYTVARKNSKEIIYATKDSDPKRMPNLLKHLEKFRPIMDERRENKTGRLKYYQLHWPRDSFFFEPGAKILSIRKCARPTFAYTESEAYVMMSVNVIRTSRANLKYLTGLFNSKLMAFWLKHKGKMQGTNYQIDKEPLVALPLYLPEKNQEKELADLVSKIMDARRRNPSADTTSLEGEINQLIYGLYGLTSEEANLIEADFSE